MKKKILMVVAVTAVLSVAPFTAFAAQSKTAAAVSKAVSEAYSFKSGNVELTAGADAAAAISSLGKPAKTFEVDSCAYQGKDKVYMYTDFEVGTYPVKGVDKISYINVLSDKVVTPEGIRIGSSVNDVVKAYGKALSEEFGTYSYKKGSTELKIFTKNKLVDGIEYSVAEAK